MSPNFRKPRLATVRPIIMSSVPLQRAVTCVCLGLMISAVPAFAQRPAAQPRSALPTTPAQQGQRSLQFVPDRFTVILEDPPVSARFGTREAMNSPAGRAYGIQVEARQQSIIREIEGRNFHVTGSVSLLINAVFVNGPSSRVDELRKMPGVVSVTPMRHFKPSLNKATAAMNAPAAWTALGGVANAGKGIKIGIIDTGIDQSHPAFQDSSLTMPAGFPLCTTGHSEDCAFTNSKVIVARSYVRTLANEWVTDPKNPAVQSQPDDYSPRDRMGHGTAVASCAAGFTVTAPGITTTGAQVSFSGMAPKAYLGNYKIYGSPGMNDYPTDDVMIAAVNDAVADGMDVISLSTGGIAISDWSTDPVAAAYEAAAKKAVVVIAAGDSGSDTYYYTTGTYPYFNSISSPATAPSAISVGATINSHIWLPSVSVASAGAPASLKNMPAALGDAAIYFDFRGYPSLTGATTGVLVDVASTGNDGMACSALPAGSLMNAIALIKRGGGTACTFDVKAINAQTAGALGVIIYNADTSDLVGPGGVGTDFLGPMVMISNANGLALQTYLKANPGLSVTIDVTGIEQDLSTFSTAYSYSPALAVNQFASYSSMGPTPDGLIKPDLVAVGGLDSGAVADATYGPLNGGGAGLYVATQSYDPTPQITSEISLYSSTGYMGADGSSLSAPIVAGAAALVKQAHPTYTPAQIKSALVNSAAQDVTTDDFGVPVDVEWMGAGRLDAGAAVKAAVTAVPSTLSFGFVPASGQLPAPIIVTLKNNGTVAVSLTNAAVANSTLAGTTVTVAPPSMTLEAGATATITVSVTGKSPVGGSYSGFVTLTSNGSVISRLPYLFMVGDGLSPNVNLIQSYAAGGPGQDGGALIVQVVDEFGVPIAGSPVKFTSATRNAVMQTATGSPACSPASSTTTVTCPTDKFGFAYADALLGTTVGSYTINITAGGITLQGAAYVSTFAPAINTGGVVDNATSLGTITPGSYAAIKGTSLLDTNNLSDYALYNNLSYDIENQNRLPLSLDYTSVSFDVPDKGISVPGYMYFVSPTQVNVLVPWELAGQSSVQVKVNVDQGAYSNVVTVPVATYVPGFLLYGGNIAIAQDLPNYNLITTANPAVRGQTIVLYAGGLGPVDLQPASGEPASSTTLSNTKTPATVSIGGQPATVIFAGLAPGLIGLYQIDVTIPTGIATGNQPITVSVGGVTSPTGIVIPIK